MTIFDTETASHVAQITAAREVENGDRNAERLENWKRRLFRDPVEVPVAIDPPKWPASRVSISTPATVTKMRRRA